MKEPVRGRERWLKAAKMIKGGLLVIYVILFLCAMGWGQNPMKAPPEELEARYPKPDGQAQSGLRELPFRFLRDVISRVDGARCPMYPTDTQFALEAARRHGVLLGLLFLVDRLFHEWSETKTAPVIVVHGRKRFYDPLDANDFWLKDSSSSLLTTEGRNYGAWQGDNLPKVWE